MEITLSTKSVVNVIVCVALIVSLSLDVNAYTVYVLSVLIINVKIVAKTYP